MTTKVFFAGILTLLTLSLASCSSSNDITDVEFQEKLTNKCEAKIIKFYKEFLHYKKEFEPNIDKSSLDFQTSERSNTLVLNYSGFDEEREKVISQYARCTFTKNGSAVVRVEILDDLEPLDTNSKPESAAPAAR